MSMKARLAAGLALYAALAVAGAHADPTYPSRPIRFIVPQTPGGMVDAAARTVAQSLSQRLGQPVVVDNRAGANAVIGTEAAAKSTPDGHTIVLILQAALVFNAAMMKNLPYDPLRDFASISLLFDTPYYLAVHDSVPARSVRELIDLARARPGKLSYASVGVGSGQHFAMEMFKAQTHVDLLHVPYKGSAQASADLLAGHVMVMFQGPTFTVGHLGAGKLRALATSGRHRTQALPDVPTISEAGVPGFEASTWFGLSAPAGVPPVVIDRLNREVGEILNSGATREKFASLYIDPAPSTPEQMTERIRTEIPLFTKLMRDAGIEPE